MGREGPTAKYCTAWRSRTGQSEEFQLDPVDLDLHPKRVRTYHPVSATGCIAGATRTPRLAPYLDALFGLSPRGQARRSTDETGSGTSVRDVPQAGSGKGTQRHRGNEEEVQDRARGKHASGSGQS